MLFNPLEHARLQQDCQVGNEILNQRVGAVNSQGQLVNKVNFGVDKFGNDLSQKEAMMRACYQARLENGRLDSQDQMDKYLNPVLDVKE